MEIMTGFKVLNIINILIVLAVFGGLAYITALAFGVLRKLDKALDIWLEKNRDN